MRRLAAMERARAHLIRLSDGTPLDPHYAPLVSELELNEANLSLEQRNSPVRLAWRHDPPTPA